MFGCGTKLSRSCFFLSCLHSRNRWPFLQTAGHTSLSSHPPICILSLRGSGPFQVSQLLSSICRWPRFGTATAPKMCKLFSHFTLCSRVLTFFNPSPWSYAVIELLYNARWHGSISPGRRQPELCRSTHQCALWRQECSWLCPIIYARNIELMLKFSLVLSRCWVPNLVLFTLVIPPIGSMFLVRYQLDVRHFLDIFWELVGMTNRKLTRTPPSVGIEC